MFGVMDVSASALSAFRVKMDVVAANVANMDTTRDATGASVPYRRKEAVLAAGAPGTKDSPGVHVAGIVEDQSPFRSVYAPGHPDAQPDGTVLYPNVDLNKEMVNAVIAMRAYEANVAAFEVSKQMLVQSLRLIA
jgi:flagellar basal-body rod protein FlgC